MISLAIPSHVYIGQQTRTDLRVLHTVYAGTKTNERLYNKTLQSISLDVCVCCIIGYWCLVLLLSPWFTTASRFYYAKHASPRYSVNIPNPPAHPPGQFQRKDKQERITVFRHSCIMHKHLTFNIMTFFRK